MIKELRKSKNLTQEKMSVIMGCSQSHLSKIERGETTPTVKNLYYIFCNLDLNLKPSGLIQLVRYYGGKDEN